MDFAGLEQYFIIGSDEKVVHSRSPRFGRVRIGQFGIGKFASLAAASRFELLTRHKDFAARVVFDKKAWEEAKDEWHLPCEILTPDPQTCDGTTVILSELSKSFLIEDVERKLVESVPLKAPDFAVYVNGRRLYPRSLVGRRIPLLEGTKYGPVTGEIVITPKSAADFKNLGIEVKVKGATVKRDLFGMETWGRAVARVKGEICADFLPITSDRSSFIVDSDGYQEFLKIMEKVVSIIGKALGKEVDRSEQRKASRAVNEALQRIHRALARNPELSPFGPLGPECFSEGNVVYVNRDHPLFQRESRKAATQTMYIARLVTQEISLMKETRSPRLAFSRQSWLLKDAFAEE